jgi:hypothetical protein
MILKMLAKVVLATPLWLHSARHSPLATHNDGTPSTTTVDCEVVGHCLVERLRQFVSPGPAQVGAQGSSAGAGRTVPGRSERAPAISPRACRSPWLGQRLTAPVSHSPAWPATGRRWGHSSAVPWVIPPVATNRHGPGGPMLHPTSPIPTFSAEQTQFGPCSLRVDAMHRLALVHVCATPAPQKPRFAPSCASPRHVWARVSRPRTLNVATSGLPLPRARGMMSAKPIFAPRSGSGGEGSAHATIRPQHPPVRPVPRAGEESPR